MIPRDGAKPLEVSGMRKALEDRRMWSGLGRVVLRDGESSHFEIETDANGNPVDVLVEMDIMPEQVPVTARLAGGMGSLGAGGWKIPAPGTEVAWIAPHGELESDLIIVATLSSNSIPAALDGDTYVLVQPKNIIIASQDGGSKVLLGSPDGSDVQPAVRGDDLIQRIENIENVLNTHVHPVPTATVTAGLPPAVIGNTTATSTTAPTTTASGSPDPRSQNVSLK